MINYYIMLTDTAGELVPEASFVLWSFQDMAVMISMYPSVAVRLLDR
jgi:hypothetical protein